MLSQKIDVKSYVELYSSLGWDSLVCHSQFLNLFFPEKAEAFAMEIVMELLEELKLRPCPVVFASFSGGSKACMYKVLQIIEGRCVVKLNMDDCKLLRDCIAGHIFDFSLVDFTGDLSRLFGSLMLSRIANGIGRGLDAVFFNKIESQRVEYWQTLHSSVSTRAPYLIMCSDNDELASYQVISNLAQRLRELGGDVKVLTMKGSSSVGHYRLFPNHYGAAVVELFGKATVVYSQRTQRLQGERIGLEHWHIEISGFGNLGKTVCCSNQSFKRVIPAPTKLHIPSSMEYYEGRGVGCMQDQRKEGLVHLRGPTSITAHGVMFYFE